MKGHHLDIVLYARMVVGGSASGLARNGISIWDPAVISSCL